MSDWYIHKEISNTPLELDLLKFNITVVAVLLSNICGYSPRRFNFSPRLRTLQEELQDISRPTYLRIAPLNVTSIVKTSV